ncbi:hypothetical protein [Limnohabitans sp.]|uniref:hypothetical protein n=1 Tax=Limnohabitans sp. TaxID=1907725 RepID=UPI00286EE209|nr:hypothetical protein [Limnohabitans sp.]
MNIYSFDRETGLFTGISLADESPLEPGVHLIPAFATPIAPPDCAARERPVFRDGKWSVVADWRGVDVFDMRTGDTKSIEEIGVSPADIGATSIAPPASMDRKTRVFADTEWKYVPDWRGIPLFSITDGSAVSITDVGKAPEDIGATDKERPSPFYKWVDGSWALDAVAHLAAIKADATDRIAIFAKSKRAMIAGTSDDAEIAGWSNKLRIAQAIVVGTATDGEKAAFQAEITARGIKGETLEIFVQKVITNAAFYAQAVALIDGLKRRAQDAVSAAKTPDEVSAVLDSMKSQAEAAFVQLMKGAT